MQQRQVIDDSALRKLLTDRLRNETGRSDVTVDALPERLRDSDETGCNWGENLLVGWDACRGDVDRHVIGRVINEARAQFME
jgi:hypothetical protein